MQIIKLNPSDKTIVFRKDEESVLILCDATNGNFEISIPDPTMAFKPISITFIKIDSSANVVTITGKINGLTSSSSTITTQWESINLVSDLEMYHDTGILSPIVNSDLGNLGTAGKIPKFATLGLTDSVIVEASDNIGIGMAPGSLKLAVAGKLEAGKFLSSVTPGAMRVTNDVNEQSLVVYGENNAGNAVAYFGTTHFGLAAYTSSSSADVFAFCAGTAVDPKVGTGVTFIFKVMANQRVGVNCAGYPLGGLHTAGGEPQLYIGTPGVTNGCIASTDGIIIAIDADNSSTGTFFAIKKDGPSYATSTMLAIFYEDGTFNLRTDGAAIKFGVDDDVTLTHIHNSGLNLAGKLGINCIPSEQLDINDTGDVYAKIISSDHNKAGLILQRGTNSDIYGDWKIIADSGNLDVYSSVSSVDTLRVRFSSDGKIYMNNLSDLTASGNKKTMVYDTVTKEIGWSS